MGKICEHRERLDGLGCPRGQKDAERVLKARMLAAPAAFDDHFAKLTQNQLQTCSHNNKKGISLNVYSGNAS